MEPFQDKNFSHGLIYPLQIPIILQTDLDGLARDALECHSKCHEDDGDSSVWEAELRAGVIERAYSYIFSWMPGRLWQDHRVGREYGGRPSDPGKRFSRLLVSS